MVRLNWSVTVSVGLLIPSKITIVCLKWPCSSITTGLPFIVRLWALSRIPTMSTVLDAALNAIVAPFFGSVISIFGPRV